MVDMSDDRDDDIIGDQPCEWCGHPMWDCECNDDFTDLDYEEYRREVE